MPEPFSLLFDVAAAARRGPDWPVYVLLVAALACAVTTREYARAWLADALGDPSPREDGRLRCAPRAHLSLVGLLLAVATALLGGVPVGWGRPLPLDPDTWKVDRRTGALLLALAGPVGNLLAALALSPFARWAWQEYARDPRGPAGLVFAVLLFLVWANLGLALVHLAVPVAPLDGARVAAALLPPSLGDAYARAMERFGPVLLLVLIASGALARYVGPLLFGLLRLLIRGG